MAEFCLECWNELNGSKDPAQRYIFSRRPELCEGCMEWKPVIVGLRLRFLLRDFFSRLFKP